jgi:hypothetical protein
MPEKKIETACKYCEMPNEISSTDLYSAIKDAPPAGRIGMTCLQCGRVNLLDVSTLPDITNLQLSEWVGKTTDALGESWLPCVFWDGLEAKLPVGEYIEPGDLLSPRLWKYKNSRLDKSPDGSVWWRWEDYASKFGFDPFIKLCLMRGPDWKKSIFGDQKPHVRTRVFSLRDI